MQRCSSFLYHRMMPGFRWELTIPIFFFKSFWKSPFPSWYLHNEQNLWQSARLTACHITASLNRNPEKRLSPLAGGKVQTSQGFLILIAEYNPNNQSFLWKKTLTPPYFLQAGEDPTTIDLGSCGLVREKRPPLHRGYWVI